jgi:hypothetical protein
MLVPSICGLCRLGLKVMVTDGALVAAEATPHNKLSPNKITRPTDNVFDTRNLRQVQLMGKHKSALFVPTILLLGQLEFLKIKAQNLENYTPDGPRSIGKTGSAGCGTRFNGEKRLPRP